MVLYSKYPALKNFYFHKNRQDLIFSCFLLTLTILVFFLPTGFSKQFGNNYQAEQIGRASCRERV